MKAVGKASGTLLCTAAILGCLATTGASAAALPAPAWSVQAVVSPTHLKPGSENGVYEAFLANSGAAVTDHSEITITDTLPEGIGVKSVELESPRGQAVPGACIPKVLGEVTTVTCKVTDPLFPSKEPAKLLPAEQLRLAIVVEVPPSASGDLTNQVEVEGGGAAEAASAEIENRISEEEAQAGFEEYHAELTGPDGQPVNGAASHPYQYTTSFAVNTELAPPGTGQPFLPAEGDLKQIEAALPPGLIGNPSAVKRCTTQQFNALHGVNSKLLGSDVSPNECPDGAVIGLVTIQQFEGGGAPPALRTPLYNLTPPKGMPAQLGFLVAGLPIYIDARLRSDGDYGISADLHDIAQAKRVTAARVTIWGTPADPSHDSMRGSCALLGGNCPAAIEAHPFMRLPSSCAGPLLTRMSFATWLHPESLLEAAFDQGNPTECDVVPFDPSIEAKPTTNVADAPAGLHFDLHVPQADNDDPEGLSEADLRQATVTLPKGFLVNPSSADGLQGCSSTEIGLASAVGELPAHFSGASPTCPDGSKLGSVTVDTPLLDHGLPGAVYLADPHENPFNSLLAIYIAVDDPISGVVVKLAGEVTLDPITGQLTTTVPNGPQTPFEDFKLDFFEGARAPLRTPAVCGTHTTTSSLEPWSAPASGPNATPTDSFEITAPPAGASACPARPDSQPNSPRFEAGSQSPIAGAYSPFLIKLSRQDGSQELKGLNLTLPAGMAAKFAGVAECSDAAIASAEAKSGKQEQAAASCPASSHLGTVTVGAGAGPAPYYVKGDAYLAGPYKGAPLSTAIITPAVAGPFDLGTVVVRAPLYIDPETAQGTVKSSFPTILEGIPLDVRSIAVAIDRRDFTLNPTSCEAKEVKAEAISVLGQSVDLNNRFQVGGCANLGFKPKLSLRLRGGTKRGAHPSLKATLTYPKGGAYSNIAYAQVALPHSEFLDQAHIGTVCTRVQFAASQCPAKSVYGFARAITPLFDKPLEGPVYLRSSSHQLPDLVAALNGQVNVVLAGRNDSIHGGIRNTFEAVPDAPVSKFTLTLKGAKKGLLQNSTDICQGTHKANARFVAHNGRVVVLRPELQASCGGKGRRGGRR